MDRIVGMIVRFMVFLSKYVVKYDTWDTSKKLKFLLVGYNGARNTGADVRVVSLVNQLEELFDPDTIEISVMTLETEDFGKYFHPHINLIKFNSIFFLDLLRACSTHHLAILCEGSTLKSTFANSLTLFFCQAAGIMKAQDKPCLAYGSEAGQMDAFVSSLAQKLCSDTYFIARTQKSLEVIRGLGLRGHLGTDTAWTFQSDEDDWAEHVLKKHGWNGAQELVGIAVINPFWWPVRPSLPKLFKSFLTRSWNYHFQKWYFFSWSDERERTYNAYLHAIAGAINTYMRTHDAFPVIIGMEQLDDQACKKLQSLLDVQAPLFVSHSYDGKQLSSLLRRLSLLVTSRYHAHVISMENAVPTVAVSMDERLSNLVGDLGLSDELLQDVADTQLEKHLVESLHYIENNRDSVQIAMGKHVSNSLSLMQDMGYYLTEYVRRSFPEFEGSESIEHEQPISYQPDVSYHKQGLPHVG